MDGLGSLDKYLGIPCFLATPPKKHRNSTVTPPPPSIIRVFLPREHPDDTCREPRADSRKNYKGGTQVDVLFLLKGNEVAGK